MNPEVKTKWLEALRSGEYLQGKEFLLRRTADGEERFCCLGVLCNLYAQEHPGTGFNLMTEETFAYVSQWMSAVTRRKKGESLFEFDRHVVNLPKEVREWAGVPAHWVQGTLAEMNDNGKSFKQIASWIEEHL